jgi:hypothetical protein
MAIVSNNSFYLVNSFKAQVVLPHQHALLLLRTISMAVNAMNHGAGR